MYGNIAKKNLEIRCNLDLSLNEYSLLVLALQHVNFENELCDYLTDEVIELQEKLPAITEFRTYERC